jgi:biopolymer transport protein ExbB/TolQ
MLTEYTAEILHKIAQVLLVPTMIILALLIVFSLYCLGSIIVEFFTEKRFFKVNMPSIINAIHDAKLEGNPKESELYKIIQESALLKKQKEAMLILVENIGLSEDDLYALAKTELNKVESGYKKKLSWTQQVTKIAPMMGLMCTLIPLGPGIVAMGQGEVNELASSLLVAFDGTVAGLTAAVIAMVITAIRKRWYDGYMVKLEAVATSILDKQKGRK